MRWQGCFATISVFSRSITHMLETNPIRARIADLRERVESLRGYL
jgi:hypothetical protein